VASDPASFRQLRGPRADGNNVGRNSSVNCSSDGGTHSRLEGLWNGNHTFPCLHRGGNRSHHGNWTRLHRNGTFPFSSWGGSDKTHIGNFSWGNGTWGNGTWGNGTWGTEPGGTEPGGTEPGGTGPWDTSTQSTAPRAQGGSRGLSEEVVQGGGAQEWDPQRYPTTALMPTTERAGATLLEVFRLLRESAAPDESTTGRTPICTMGPTPICTTVPTSTWTRYPPSPPQWDKGWQPHCAQAGEGQGEGEGEGEGEGPQVPGVHASTRALAARREIHCSSGVLNPKL